MKTMRRLLAVASGASLLLGATAASAVQVDVTYTGVVSSGYDTTGVFGPADTDLTNAPFTLLFVADPDPNAPPLYDDGLGDIGYSEQVIQDVDLTVNGVTQQIIPNAANLDIGEMISGLGSQFQYGLSYYNDDANAALISLWASSPDLPASLTQAFGPTAVAPLSDSPGPGSLDSFSFSHLVGDGYVPSASGQLLPITAFATVSAIPEPQAWILMMLGVVGIGSSLRRAKRKTVWRLPTALPA